MAKFLPNYATNFSNERKNLAGQKICFSKSRQKAENEVLALDSYLRKQVTIGRSATGDLDKSAALATFQKKSEKSLIFQHHFGNPAPNRD